MTYKKGESGNPAGRPKGAVNKTTKQFREALEATGFDAPAEAEQPVSWLGSLYSRLSVLLKTRSSKAYFAITIFSPATHTKSGEACH